MPTQTIRKMLIRRSLHCFTQGEIGHVEVFNQRKRCFSANDLPARLVFPIMTITGDLSRRSPWIPPISASPGYAFIPAYPGRWVFDLG